MSEAAPQPLSKPLAFIGGGNMASAIIGGLLKQGVDAQAIEVVEPHEPTRERLHSQFGLRAMAVPGPQLQHAALVVWAVKPQTFREAAAQVLPQLAQPLHLSVAAGIRSDSIAQWLQTQRIVRSMPNTPALVGKGMTGLFARGAATAADKALVEQVLSSTGECLWVAAEDQLDAVTALSGSGPAYVFLFLEAMIEAGTQMGLAREQARRLAIGTFAGASELARASQDAPEVLRERVTSKGGTTHAAITSMQQDGLPQAFIKAMHAARARAQAVGHEFGAG
jgi:pyrroline-5-carboxylate reductase